MREDGAISAYVELFRGLMILALCLWWGSTPKTDSNGSVFGTRMGQHVTHQKVCGFCLSDQACEDCGLKGSGN